MRTWLLLVLLCTGCTWTPRLNPDRPGVTWVDCTALRTLACLAVLDAHAEDLYPVSFAVWRAK